MKVGTVKKKELQTCAGGYGMVRAVQIVAHGTAETAQPPSR
jgi:hypothetical protein